MSAWSPSQAAAYKAEVAGLYTEGLANSTKARQGLHRLLSIAGRHGFAISVGGVKLSKDVPPLQQDVQQQGVAVDGAGEAAAPSGKKKRRKSEAQRAKSRAKLEEKWAKRRVQQQQQQPAIVPAPPAGAAGGGTTSTCLAAPVASQQQRANVPAPPSCAASGGTVSTSLAAPVASLFEAAAGADRMVVDEKSLKRHQQSPAVGQSPSISAPKRAMPPPLPSGHTGPALLPPSLAPPAGAAPATVNSFINAALVEAEAGALAMHVRRLADQVAFETCSDLNVIVAGMLQAESESQKRDAYPTCRSCRGIVSRRRSRLARSARA